MSTFPGIQAITPLPGKVRLFVGNPESGQLATLMTLAFACDLNGVNPEEYLKDVLPRVRTATTPNQIAALLPHNWKPLTPAAWSNFGYHANARLRKSLDLSSHAPDRQVTLHSSHECSGISNECSGIFHDRRNPPDEGEVDVDL